MNRDELIQAIRQVAYLEGDFITRAGKPTSFYIDKYLFETNPRILSSLAQHLLGLLPSPDSYHRIAAPELGAVPIASVLSVMVDKPFIIVKKETKTYGTQKLVEGSYQMGERVVVVEDILTTGGAALRACEVVTQLGLSVEKVVGVINREEGAIEAIIDKGFGVDALITKTELQQCIPLSTD